MAIVVAIGSAVPSIINARTAETPAPIKFWRNPKKEDAVPAIVWNGLSALAVDNGHSNENPIAKTAMVPKILQGSLNPAKVNTSIEIPPRNWSIPPIIIKRCIPIRSTKRLEIKVFMRITKITPAK